MYGARPNPTGYGWLIRMPNGELREFATDQEALEAVADEADGEEE